MHRRSRYEIIDSSSDDDNDSKSHCKHCLKFGFSVPLKNRIYPNNEPIPVDHDQWRQCHECGTVVPIYELEKEATIKDVVETVDNPFDSGIDFLGIDSRASQRRKGKKRKSRFSYKHEGPDPEIQAEIDKGKIVNILYDSNR